MLDYDKPLYKDLQARCGTRKVQVIHESEFEAYVLPDLFNFALQCGIYPSQEFKPVYGIVDTIEGHDILCGLLLATPAHSSHFAIHVCVPPQYQGLGYEEMLGHCATKCLESFQETHANLEMKIASTQGWLKNVFKSQGFTETGRDPDHITMTKTSSQILKSLGGTTIFGLKKVVADRIDRKFRLYEVEPFSSTLSFKSQREARFLISAKRKNGTALSDFAVDYIARDIADDLKRSLGYQRLEGSGFYAEFNSSLQIILTQRII